MYKCSSLFRGGYKTRYKRLPYIYINVSAGLWPSTLKFTFVFAQDEIMETSASLTQQLDKLGSQSTTWKRMCSRIHQNIWVPLFQIPCAETLQDPGLIHAFPRIFFEVLLDICSKSYMKCDKIVKWGHGPWSMVMVMVMFWRTNKEGFINRSYVHVMKRTWKW